MSSLLKRREAREIALKILFQLDMGYVTQKEACNWILEEYKPVKASFEFALRLISKVLENLEAIDIMIEQAALNWRLDRMATVDRAILRLATCEIMLFSDIPVSVSINEAVELAKKYSTAESSGFVNGVLGSMVKSEEKKKEGIKG